MAYRDWPKQALKLIVLVACSTAVIFQLSECIMKLCYPPVSTHTELDMNATMSYPAITICRNPPYKADVLKRHGLGTEIRYTSEWSKFPFNTTTLTTFWREATYSQAETIKQYGLNKLAEHVELTSAMYFLSGQCHTLRPVVTTQEAGTEAGFSITLRHSSSPVNQQPWSAYVHQPSDVWTENNLQTTGIQELIVVPVGQEVQVKLSVQQLKRVNHPKVPCRADERYSATRCEEQCRWSEMAQEAACSVPWMPGTGLPECDNYEAMHDVMVEYLKFVPNPDCTKMCERACYASQFAAYIVNRSPVPVELPKTFSQLYVFHSSKLVTSVREHWDYDLSRFVADAGGSLGFLLGVSVLSLVSLLAKMFRSFATCGRAPPTKDGGQTDDDASDDTSSVGSGTSGSIHSKVTLVVGQKY